MRANWMTSIVAVLLLCGFSQGQTLYAKRYVLGESILESPAGSRDFTAGIQAVLNRLEPCTIVIPAGIPADVANNSLPAATGGNFKITSPLLIKASHTRFIGEGENSILRYAPVSSGTSQLEVSAIVAGEDSGSPLSNLEFAGFTLLRESSATATALTGSANHGISIRKAGANIQVSDCQFINFVPTSQFPNSCGIYISCHRGSSELGNPVEGIRIRGNRFVGNGDGNPLAAPSGSAPSPNSIATIAEAASSGDIVVTGEPFHVAISNNLCVTVGQTGIFFGAEGHSSGKVVGSGSVVISDNIVRNKGRSGITLGYYGPAASTSGAGEVLRRLEMSVQSNVISNCARTGIYFFDNNYHKVTNPNRQFDYSSDNGSLTIGGNTITRVAWIGSDPNADAARGAICVIGKSGSVTVHGNSISRSGTSTLRVDGIAVYSTETSTVTGNSIEGVSGRGVLHSDCGRVVAASNTISDTLDTAIEIRDNGGGTGASREKLTSLQSAVITGNSVNVNIANKAGVLVHLPRTINNLENAAPSSLICNSNVINRRGVSNNNIKAIEVTRGSSETTTALGSFFRNVINGFGPQSTPPAGLSEDDWFTKIYHPTGVIDLIPNNVVLP